MFDPISPTYPHRTAREQLARSLGTLFATDLCTPYSPRLGAFGMSPCFATTTLCRLDRLTSQARYVRGYVSVGRIRARCLSVRLPNPPVRTVLAAFIAHGSREKDVYRKCPFRQLHGVHRGQLARSLTTFVPFSLPSPSGPSPCI